MCLISECVCCPVNKTRRKKKEKTAVIVTTNFPHDCKNTALLSFSRPARLHCNCSSHCIYGTVITWPWEQWRRLRPTWSSTNLSLLFFGGVIRSRLFLYLSSSPSFLVLFSMSAIKSVLPQVWVCSHAKAELWSLNLTTRSRVCWICWGYPSRKRARRKHLGWQGATFSKGDCINLSQKQRLTGLEVGMQRMDLIMNH